MVLIWRKSVDLHLLTLPGFLRQRLLRSWSCSGIKILPSRKWHAASIAIIIVQPLLPMRLPAMVDWKLGGKSHSVTSTCWFVITVIWYVGAGMLEYYSVCCFVFPVPWTVASWETIVWIYCADIVGTKITFNLWTIGAATGLADCWLEPEYELRVACRRTQYSMMYSG